MEETDIQLNEENLKKKQQFEELYKKHGQYFLFNGNIKIMLIIFQINSLKK